MRRYCRIELLQMHHSHLRRPLPPIQSACHHPLIPTTCCTSQQAASDVKRGERSSATYLQCSPRAPILRYEHLSAFSIRTSLVMRHGDSALHLLRWKRRPYPSNSTRAQRTIPLLSICHANTSQTVAQYSPGAMMFVRLSISRRYA